MGHARRQVSRAASKISLSLASEALNEACPRSEAARLGRREISCCIWCERLVGRNGQRLSRRAPGNRHALRLRTDAHDLRHASAPIRYHPHVGGTVEYTLSVARQSAKPHLIPVWQQLHAVEVGDVLKHCQRRRAESVISPPPCLR